MVYIHNGSMVKPVLLWYATVELIMAPICLIMSVCIDLVSSRLIENELYTAILPGRHISDSDRIN